MTAYRNPWAARGAPPEICTEAKPIFHAGAEIYHVSEQQWDVVKGGCCIAQYAGLSFAKQAAEAVEDVLLPTPDDVSERMLERYGHL